MAARHDTAVKETAQINGTTFILLSDSLRLMLMPFIWLFYKLIKSENEIILDDGRFCSQRMLLYCQGSAQQPACHVTSHVGPATEMLITLAYFTTMLHIPQTALIRKRKIVSDVPDRDPLLSTGAFWSALMSNLIPDCWTSVEVFTLVGWFVSRIPLTLGWRWVSDQNRPH